MDLSNLTPGGTAGPLAALAAAGSAITILTEVVKQYLPSERIPPPLIAALIAAVFTGAWIAAQVDPPTIRDGMTVLLIWVALFQVSIGVYHGARLTARAGQDDKIKAALDTQAAHYDRFMAIRDDRIATLEAQIQPSPVVGTAETVVVAPQQPEPEGR